MSGALTTFTFAPANAVIRVVEIEGSPWFVARDVLQAVGLTHVSNALGPLDGAEKGSNRITTPGGPQTVRTVSESGLYKLVLRSDKPQARAFQDWVTRDVLPAIRKDGAYVMGEEKLSDPALTMTGMALTIP